MCSSDLETTVELEQPAHDRIQPADTATIFSLALPYAAAPKGRIAFTVRRPDRNDEPVVDVE